MPKLLAPFLMFCVLLLIQCGKRQPPMIFSKADGPHLIDADLYIEINQDLIIEAGTELIIGDSVDLVIEGSLYINGTAAEPVHIKGSFKQPGWGSIQLQTSAEKLVITHTIIEDGTLLSHRTDNYLAHVHFINSQDVNWRTAMARFEVGDLLKENCTATGINKAEGFLVHHIEDPIVRNCTFKDIPDAVEYISCKNGLITHNVFMGGSDDAIDLNACISTKLEHNDIDGYNSAGMEIGSEQLGRSINIKTQHNSIRNCSLGVYLKEASSVEMTKDSLIGNRIGLDISTPPDSLDLSSAVLNQCFFSNNQQEINKDERSLIEIND